ncbi:MAG: exo-alpha-sialidase, partial [Streptomycetaceae bacterium]|nr:exo-alpha-sialidase [Streptomycetaceae bacterium]
AGLAAQSNGATVRGAASAGHQAPYACRQDIHAQDPAYPSVHVASIVQAPNGDLLYGFYGGSHEGAPDVANYVARLPVGSNTWQAPQVAFKEPGKPGGNAVLWTEGRTTYLFFATIEGNSWAQSNLRMIKSMDNGHTWSAPTMIHARWGWLFGTAPVRMSNGQVLVPIYSQSQWRVAWLLPSQNYTKWTVYPLQDGRFGPSGAAPSLPVRNWPTAPGGAIQPTTVETSPGNLLAYLRTGNGSIYQTQGSRYGRLWTTPTRTNFPNNNSRIALLKLHDGNMVLAYNPTSDQSDRSVLALNYYDAQRGVWTNPGVTVENEPGQEFSYPYLYQSADGAIHLGYTHQRRTMRDVVFNEAYLTSGQHSLPSDDSVGATSYQQGRIVKTASCDYVNRGR